MLYYSGVRCIHAEVVEPELGSIGLFLIRHVRYPLYFESFLWISIHYNSCCILDRPQDISRTVSFVDTYLNIRSYIVDFYLYLYNIYPSRFWVVCIYTINNNIPWRYRPLQYTTLACSDFFICHIIYTTVTKTIKKHDNSYRLAHCSR